MGHQEVINLAATDTTSIPYKVTGGQIDQARWLTGGRLRETGVADFSQALLHG